MIVVPLPLDPGTQARTILHHLLERGDLVGRDAGGRTVITLAVDDRLLERLLTFDADAEEGEDNGRRRAGRRRGGGWASFRSLIRLDPKFAP